MYKLKPAKVFINTRVYDDEAATRRLERMMTNIECESVHEFSDQDLARIYAEEGWEELRHGHKRQGEHEFQSDPVMVFGAFNWDFDPAVDKAPPGSMRSPWSVARAAPAPPSRARRGSWSRTSGIAASRSAVAT